MLCVCGLLRAMTRLRMRMRICMHSNAQEDESGIRQSLADIFELLDHEIARVGTERVDFFQGVIF